MIPASARALIMVGYGNAPVDDANWRAGAVDVANLKCRAGWWEGSPFGGGEWHFLYRSDTVTFNEALKVFAKVRAPSLELIVHDGPGESVFLKDQESPKSQPRHENQAGDQISLTIQHIDEKAHVDEKAKSQTRYDWDFVTWNVQSYYRLYGNPKGFLADDPNFRQPLPPPRINVFLGGGAIQWDKVEVPKGITVIDRRAATAGVKPGQGAVIAGNVFDMLTGKPLAAKIFLDQPKTAGREYATDDQGRFRIERLPAGGYNVFFSATGHAALMRYANLVADGYLALDDVELAPLVTVSGSVTDEADKPIAGATVRVDRDSLGVNGQSYKLRDQVQAISDVHGRFQITGAPQGYGRLLGFAAHYWAPPGEILALPATDVMIRMSRTGTIKGKVSGAVQGRMIRVSVEAEGEQIGKWGADMQVQPDSTFGFDGIPPGTYFVTVGGLYSPWSFGGPAVQAQANANAKAKKITITAGQTVEVELTP